MASFSSKYPVAYHVFPLHLARTLWKTGQLFGKQDLGPSSLQRRTTAAVDRALGLQDVVHLYLASSRAKPEDLPILGAQLGPSSRPAFPHATLVLETETLQDSEVRISNWNLAVSRPKVDGICKGGNWARGTNASPIVQIWSEFKKSHPSPSQARGFWKPGVLVPLLEGDEVCEHISWLSKAPRRLPELLLRSGFEISRFSRVVVFSEPDLASIRLAGPVPGSLPIEVWPFVGYGSESIAVDLRRSINAILDGQVKADANLDFDAVRPRREE